jgi:formylglycine-generating enzyme required for sulfatase activity
LWAVVAFVGLVTAVVYLWPGNRPGGEGRREQDRKTALPEVTVDPIETLQTYIGVLEEQVRGDSSGVSTAKLMNALIELNSLGGSDSLVLGRIHELAYRADSLAVISSRTNHLDGADSFLDESRNGWVTLLRLAENDSFFNERLEWNREYRSVVKARRSILESMILISEGSFTRGSNRGAFDSRPASEIELSAFYISTYEITNNQYRAFIFDTGRAGPAARNQYEKPYGWIDSQFPEGKGDYPVVLVKWEDAKAFAEWLGGSLPSEAQWEKAARGSDGRHYPWGNGFYGDSLICRESRSEYSPVGFRSGDLSPVGVHDMAGSVREWTNDWYGSDYYLTRSSRQKDADGPRSGRFRVVRGASWRTEGAVYGLTHARDNASPWTINRDLGFRVSFAESTFRSLPIFTSLR